MKTRTTKSMSISTMLPQSDIVYDNQIPEHKYYANHKTT